MPPQQLEQLRPRHALQRRGVTVDRSLIIGVSVAAGVVLILVAIWIIRRARAKPPNPLPPVRPTSTFYTGSTDRIFDKHAVYDSVDASSSSPWVGSTSGTSTPTHPRKPLKLDSDQAYNADDHEHPPHRPWIKSPPRSVTSLESDSNASTAHSITPTDPLETPTSAASASTPMLSATSDDVRQARHKSMNSMSRNSLVSAASRRSVYNNGPVRGAPHKTGIQVVLPEPLAPSLYASDDAGSVHDHSRAPSRSSIHAKKSTRRVSRVDTWTDLSRHDSTSGRQQDIQLVPPPAHTMPSSFRAPSSPDGSTQRGTSRRSSLGPTDQQDHRAPTRPSSTEPTTQALSKQNYSNPELTRMLPDNDAPRGRDRRPSETRRP